MKSGSRCQLQLQIITDMTMLKTKIWISNVICHCLFMFNDLRLEVIVRFVDIGGFIDHSCLD